MSADEGGGGTPLPPLVSPRRLAGAPATSRLQSPASQQFCLGSNDDQLERAQARAARAAAVRRKSVAVQPPPAPSGNSDLLCEEQIADLFNNCIKLASENKINQKNTWELGLIDHLSEIIRVGNEDDAETDFRKASCTLEAGVKIYSMRVDSVHSDAYKVLGGMNRAGREDETENDTGVAGDQIEQTEGVSKKDLEKKLSPLSTLESSFEALNIKKFDVAFTVDPLYHQTTAKFDEGGAKGLLLYNLGIYGGCRILFDSFEIPTNCMLSEAQHKGSEVVDLSFAKEQIEQMKDMSTKNDISPTLRDILSYLDGVDSRQDCASFTQDVSHATTCTDWESNEYDNGGMSSIDETNQFDTFGNSSPIDDHNFCSHQEDDDDYKLYEPDIDTNLEEITAFLSLGMGISTKSNAWAGPEHWKYQKAKDLDKNPILEGATIQSRKIKSRKKEVFDIEFTKSLENELPDVFVGPKSSRALLLQRDKEICSVRLPEDWHYKPDSLVRLFILPNVMALGKKRRHLNDESREHHSTPFASFAWDNESGTNEEYDDEHSFADVHSFVEAEDFGPLVAQPPQVNKIEIQYDKVSRQVDVHALKETIWIRIKESIHIPDTEISQAATTCFRQVLSGFPSVGGDGALSPHMAFICLLHLANEHGLSICGRDGLDNLDIHIPTRSIATDSSPATTMLGSM